MPQVSRGSTLERRTMSTSQQCLPCPAPVSPFLGPAWPRGLASVRADLNGQHATGLAAGCHI